MLIGIDASRAVIEQRTGTEVYSLRLIRELVEIGTRHHFRLYFNAPPAPGLIPDATHCEQRVMPFPRLWTHLRLSAEMLARPPDVLFVPSHVLPLVHPQRSVVTVHDLGHRYYPQAHTPAQRRYLEWSARYHVRKAAHLLADSQATKDDLVRLYGANPATVTVAHLGIDPALHPVRDIECIARIKQAIGIHGPYLLYVGTIQPRKNLARLIDAFAQVLRICQVPDLQLVLAGKTGWLCDDIVERTKQLGLGNRVVLPGFVRDADLATLYSGADLFVMPSVSEPFGLVPLEALRNDVPVIISKQSGVAEILTHALKVDFWDINEMANKIIAVLRHPPLQATLREHGNFEVRRISWKDSAQRCLDVYQSVMVPV